MTVPLQLDKLEVARRQLETAIDLFAAAGDAVSIHTLVAASYEVLDQVARARGLPGMNLIATMEARFPPDIVRRLLPLMRKAQNFFKHADRDPEDSYEFQPEQTEFILFDACTKFPELAGSCPSKLTAFSYWFLVEYDLPYRFNPEQKAAIESVRASYGGVDRRLFFRDMFYVLERL